MHSRYLVVVVVVVVVLIIILSFATSMMIAMISIDYNCVDTTIMQIT